MTMNEILNYITPNDVGVLSDNDSASIQNAVDRASESGLNTVVIPRLNGRTGEAKWVISETILLPDDITVILDNCHMIMADDVIANMFRNKNMYTEISRSKAGTQHNITIRGEGYAILDGGKPNGLFEMTSSKFGLPSIRYNNLILMQNVDGFCVENIRVQNQRWWALNFIYCCNGTVSDIHSHADNSIPNQDGVNLRIGCHDITIQRITGQSGDDLVALTALCGTDLALTVDDDPPDIHDVTIRDIVGTSVRQGVVALRNQDSSKLYNILVENVVRTNGNDFNNRPYGVVRVGENAYFKKFECPMGSTHDITVRNVYSDIGRTVTVGATLTNCTFENIRANSGADTLITTDPWQGCSGVKLKDCTFRNLYAAPDLKRSPIDFSNMRDGDYVEGLVIEGLEYDGPHEKIAKRDGNRYDIKLEEVAK